VNPHPEPQPVAFGGVSDETVCGWCGEKGATVVLVTVTPQGAAEHKLLDYYQRRGFANTGRLILERDLGNSQP
jgi:hypothetical protein